MLTDSSGAFLFRLKAWKEDGNRTDVDTMVSHCFRMAENHWFRENGPNGCEAALHDSVLQQRGKKLGKFGRSVCVCVCFHTRIASMLLIYF